MRPIGLYVHWPFCARICPYCDFTVAKNRAVDEAAWQAVLLDDLRYFADLAEKRPLRSIYFGGGTPSLMPFGIAGAVIEEAESLFGLEPNCEITIEANPDDRARFADLRAAGFERLSLGVQSFDQEALNFLGRNHDSAEAEAAVSEAVRTFERVSLDFIYARPEQSLKAWEAELRRAAASGAGHLSLYQLTIEQGTAFGRAASRGTLRPMPDDRAASFYEATQALTGELGFPVYEVSNHARPGEEAVHNRLYWQDADWVAIGPGAHGRMGPPEARLATEGVREPLRYPLLALEDRLTVSKLSLAEHRMEVLAGGLRPTCGLDLERLGDDAAAVGAAAQRFVDGGVMTWRAGRLAATEEGRLVLDYLTAELAEVLSVEASGPA